jgi:hypothetical protein
MHRHKQRKTKTKTHRRAIAVALDTAASDAIWDIGTVGWNAQPAIEYSQQDKERDYQ